MPVPRCSTCRVAWVLRVSFVFPRDGGDMRTEWLYQRDCAHKRAETPTFDPDEHYPLTIPGVDAATSQRVLDVGRAVAAAPPRRRGRYVSGALVPWTLIEQLRSALAELDGGE